MTILARAAEAARQAIVEYIGWYNGTGRTAPSATEAPPNTKTGTRSGM
jgi:hypothetical protein